MNRKKDGGPLHCVTFNDCQLCVGPAKAAEHLLLPCPAYCGMGSTFCFKTKGGRGKYEYLKKEEHV